MTTCQNCSQILEAKSDIQTKRNSKMFCDAPMKISLTSWISVLFGTLSGEWQLLKRCSIHGFSRDCPKKCWSITRKCLATKMTKWEWSSLRWRTYRDSQKIKRTNRSMTFWMRSGRTRRRRGRFCSRRAALNQVEIIWRGKRSRRVSVRKHPGLKTAPTTSGLRSPWDPSSTTQAIRRHSKSPRCICKPTKWPRRSL